jgi:M6 family metalloprotease-like protein|tara:strand:- start:1621 stop:3594 length:1974 start_codon:yes stop_codon:yes gene_type:complete
MKSVRYAVALVLILLGGMINLNPDLVDSKVTPGIDDNDQDSNLVGLQNSEEWLVLRVAFPGKPHSESITESIFDMDGDGSPHLSASQYVRQMSGGHSTLTVTLSEEVWISSEDEGYWGADSPGTRDSGIDGRGVEGLVEDSVYALLGNSNLSRWDYNGDGIVDRLLVLHSGEAQESGASSNSIWSHFSELQEPISIGEWTVEHYTISSLNSGLGTVVHEMLHQMGAFDLYDVHSELPSNNWNGLGDWDIMASGNWNDNGRTPSMPGAATLGLVSSNGIIEIDTSLDGSYEIDSISSVSLATRVLSLETAPGERVLISLRSDSGFDSALPGHGIIVEYQDVNNGNSEDNTVNHDPNYAWVKIIEADGDDALVRNRDSGSEGDTFSVNDSFGSQGVVIRDNRGRVVHWTATVTQILDSSATIEIMTSSTPTTSVLTERNPIQLLDGESSYALVNTPSQCNLIVNVSAVLGSPVEKSIVIPAGLSEVPILRYSDTSLQMGTLIGSIGCEGENPVSIRLNWQKIGNRITSQNLESVIDWEKPSSISIDLDYEGTGPRDYFIAIEGAAARIATVTTQGEIGPGDPLVIEIDPLGLMEPGMYARGEVVFQDESGLENRVGVTLIAESPFTGNGILGWLSKPSNGLPIICILLALSVLTGQKRE